MTILESSFENDKFDILALLLLIPESLLYSTFFYEAPFFYSIMTGLREVLI